MKLYSTWSHCEACFRSGNDLRGIGQDLTANTRSRAYRKLESDLEKKGSSSWKNQQVGAFSTVSTILRWES
jgi:hypothetical protein